MSLLERIREANQHRLCGFLPFEVASERLGWVRTGIAERLLRRPEVFARDAERLTLSPELNRRDASCEARTRAVQQVCLELRGEGLIDGWRDECYPVCRQWGAAPALLLERAAVPLFGVTAYGVHMNGFVRGANGGLRMWVAKRSMSKPTGPGKLDQLVAGGQPHGIGLVDNMVKECAEEAGIAEQLAREARSVGAISYVLETGKGLRPDVIFNFDLELPESFRPVNGDGEVEAFYLMDMDEVLELVKSTQRFKFNCALVVIDFMIRHGVIGADHPDYEALVLGLRPSVSIAPPHSQPTRTA